MPSETRRKNLLNVVAIFTWKCIFPNFEVFFSRKLCFSILIQKTDMNFIIFQTRLNSTLKVNYTKISAQPKNSEDEFLKVWNFSTQLSHKSLENLNSNCSQITQESFDSKVCRLVTISDCVYTTFHQLVSSWKLLRHINEFLFWQGRNIVCCHQKNVEHKREAFSLVPLSFETFSGLKSLIIDKEWFSCFMPFQSENP